MHKLFERLQQSIEEFIEQRDDLIMIAACTENDMPLMLKTLEGIEQATATDVFLLFADKFIEPVPYVSVLIERLKVEHRIACEGLAEKGQDPLPIFPHSLSEESRSPVERLREAIVFARSLLPKHGSHRLVWAMLPEKITNRRAYLALVSSFVPRQGITPWMAGLRLIFRDEADSEQFEPALASAQRVRLLKADVGPAAIEASLKEEVSDEKLPEDKRMQSLLALACQDYAHNRLQEAAAKYNILLGYYQKTENLLMQAFVINGMGDIFHRSGDMEKARYWYECAVPPSVESQSPVIMATVGRNLGDISFKQQRYKEAEQYFDTLDKLAAHMLDPESKARALEWRGLSQEKQGDHRRAIESWESAVKLCHNTELPELLKVNLEHLKRVNSLRSVRDK